MFFNKKISFIFILLFFSMSYLNSETLKLEDYLRIQMQKEFLLKSELQQLEIQKEDFEIASDLWASQLDMNLKKERTTRLESTENPSDPQYVHLGVLQNTPFGAQFTLSTQKYIENSTPKYLDVETEFSFQWSQSLWNNAFGKGDRLKKDQSKILLEAQEENFKDQRINICKSLAGQFFTAYLAQRETEVYKDKFQSAKKALKLTQRHYKNKLIKKIDFLASKIELSLSESELKNKQIEKSNAFKALKLNSQTLKLQKPKFFSELDLKKMNYAKSFALKNKEKQFEAARVNTRAEKEDSKSNLELEVTLAKYNGETLSSEPYQDEFVGLGLKWSWPLFSQTKRAQLHQALLKERQAEYLKINQEELDHIQFENTKNQLKNLKEQILSYENRSNLLKEQLKEAEKLLKNARIEFQDYLRYQNLYYQQSLLQLRTQSQYWLERIQLFNYSRGGMNICGG